MGYFCAKNTFLQPKHYIQRIYLTLPSTTCVKIHQITYFSFETKSYFSRHHSSVFFSLNITYFLQKQPIKVQIFTLSTAHIKIHRIHQVIFGTTSQFFFKLCIFLWCHETSLPFHLNLYVLWIKRAHQSENFQTFDCPHEN